MTDFYLPPIGLGWLSEDASYPAGPRTDEQIMADARAYLAGVREEEEKRRQWVALFAARIEADLASWGGSSNLIGTLEAGDADEVISACFDAVVQGWQTYVTGQMQVVDAPGWRARWRRLRARVRG